eukprot:1554814-Pyramimonas_sp.AAC.1
MAGSALLFAALNWLRSFCVMVTICPSSSTSVDRAAGLAESAEAQAGFLRAGVENLSSAFGVDL